MDDKYARFQVSFGSVWFSMVLAGHGFMTVTAQGGASN